MSIPNINHMKFPATGFLCGALLLMICFCGCTQSPGPEREEPGGRITGLTWYLVSYDVNGSPETVINGTTITAIFDGTGTVSGSAGCTPYTALYTGRLERLAIDQPVTAGTDCGSPEGIMIQETRYLATIQRSSSYAVGNNTLEIRDDTGDTLLIYTAIPPDILATWRIVTFGTSSGQTWTPGTLTTISLRFNPDGSISGNAGCNDYRGVYQIIGENSVAITPSGMTKMFCGIGGVMDLETAYSDLLPKMTRYSLGDGRLYLSDATGDIRMICDIKPVW
jgi:heat shock protein HslJ